ncbi:MAG: tRNA (adenosine(37)-N6)-dimethylallyltransferase MiaA [Peptococcaceae bacterium]|nr:tRNA (adenosine(37)-N6)-dimethylallyltransferase MiaA [Peptococcaceae bacterium]
MQTIVIVGPTAVGKSDLGLLLAQAANGEIVSGDSVQVYRDFSIGSAKPSPADRESVPHHLIDILDPDEPFSAARFQSLAREAVKDIRERGRLPIVVGGTGLYIRAFLDPFDFPQPGTPGLLTKWTDLARRMGTPHLHALLREWDPESASLLHYNDKARIIRALEVYESTHVPLSKQRAYNERIYPPLENVMLVGLEMDRALLYRRIEERCELMIRQGLLEETADLLKRGCSPSYKPMRSIGYRHGVDYLRGFTTRQEMERLFKRDTRRFAKRQITWFKRDPRVIWYNVNILSKNRILNTLLDSCKCNKSPVKF